MLPSAPATTTVAPPTITVTVPRTGLVVDLTWATQHGDVLITSDHPLTIQPVAENAVRIVRGRG